jgi:hypothetical protein
VRISSKIPFAIPTKLQNSQVFLSAKLLIFGDNVIILGCIVWAFSSWTMEDCSESGKLRLQVKKAMWLA